MKRILFGLGLMCVMSVLPIWSQPSPFDNLPELLYTEGKTFFQEKNYAASARYFDEYLAQPVNMESEQVREARYYRAMTAYLLHQDDAQTRLQDYQARYPYATENDQIHLLVGILEFERGKYKQTLQHLEQVRPHRVSREEWQQVLYYRGYSYVQQEKFDKGAYDFYELLKYADCPYKQQAHYYYGYAQYRMGHYSTALEHLKEVSGNPDFKQTTPYLICQCNYQLGDCEEVINYGEDVFAKSSKVQYAAQIKHMMGACYFKAENFEKSTACLHDYQKATKKLSRDDWYMLGISAYRTQQSTLAVEALSKVTTKDDALTQNSYYHIALSYLQQADKKNARLAFERAAYYSYNKTMQEDALYNYALATYECSYAPFNESVSAFERFLKEFPNSKYESKVYEYLLNVYLTTKNYDAAYKSIQSIPHKQPAILAAEQRVLFGMGTTAMVNRQYGAASKHFETLLNNKSYDAVLTARSRYWYGECLYRTGRYNEAQEQYSKYLSTIGSRTGTEYALAHYGMGYTYFQKAEYTDACIWFRKYIALPDIDKVMHVDACNRIGDCYFQQSRYDQAKSAYDEALHVGLKLQGSDYALYQKAFACGLQKDYQGKINLLRQLVADYPKSDLTDDAWLEIGSAQVALNKNDDAIATYEQIVRNYPKTNPIVRKSRLQMAMLQYNDGKTEQAVATYKAVIAQYPNTAESETALSSLEAILVDQNRVSEYTALTESLGKGSSSQTDSLTYKAAEKIYFRDQYAEAAAAFGKYLETYPKGRYASLARYYKANCHYRLNQTDEAAESYAALSTDEQNPNMVETLVRAAALNYNKANYQAAVGYYEQLYKTADANRKKEALVGQLRCYAHLQQHEQTASVATSIIDNYASDSELLTEARYNRMKANLALGKGNLATEDINILSADTRTAWGAEAKYLKAERAYQAQLVDEAEKEIFDFIDKGTPCMYWMAKSFLLLSDVYMGKGNYFEAKQYLLSLSENYTEDNTEIKEGIQTRLAQIEQHENESVSEE